MPSVLPSAKVLVTGANGYIASHVVKTLIARGFNVRGTVRSEDKGEYLVSLFGSEKFEYVLVPDMAATGAFDEAVKGVDAVEHIATSVSAPAGDPELTIRPAVDGTLQILESIKKFGKSVKRVVITSSAVSVIDFAKYQGVKKDHTEDDWNNSVLEIVKAQGANSSGFDKYMASKVIAERAAWKWLEDNKNVGFDIVILCPSWVWGPMVHKITSARDINDTNKYLVNNILVTKTQPDELLPTQSDMVDVRDVAVAHTDILLKDEAANKRFILSAYTHSWQDIYNTLHNPAIFEGAPLGLPSVEAPESLHTFKSTKLETVLGCSPGTFFRPLRETIRDIQARGLWGESVKHFGPQKA